MASRLYLTNAAAGYTPTTKRGAWDNSSASLARQLGFVPAGTAATAGVADGTANTNNLDILLGRWISEPVDRAGELSGTAEWIMGALESNLNANDMWHVHIFATAGDSNTVRGTLLADSIGTTEWPTTATARGEGAKTLTDVDLQVGDRVVVEIGYQAQNTSTTSYTGTVNYGNTGTTDLASGNTGANLTGRPGWIEFSDPLALLRKHADSLTDDFNDNSVNTTKWPGNAGTVAETGGRARVTHLASNGSYFGSGAVYTLAESSILARVYPGAPGAATSAETQFSFYVDPPNYTEAVQLIVEQAASVNMAYVLGGAYSWVEGPAAYDATAHAWLRLRETGGTLYAEGSPDGYTWTVLLSHATPAGTLAARAGEIDLDCYRVGGSNFYSEYDNFNLPPTPPLVLVETLTDDFDDGTVDAVKWPNSYGTVSESGGVGRVTAGTSLSGYGSDRVYALAGSAVSVKATPATISGATESTARLVAYLDPFTTYGSAVQLVADNAAATGGLRWTFRLRNVVQWSDAIVGAYDPVDHAWLRLREDSGTLYAETSPDGTTWTAQFNRPTPPLVTSSRQVEIELEASRTGGAADGIATFDRLNLGPVVVAAASTATIAAATAAASISHTPAGAVTATRTAAATATAAATSPIAVTAATTSTATVAAAAMNPTTVVNMGANTGFEWDSNSDGLADGWTVYGSPTCTLDTSVKRSGTRSQKIVVGSGLNEDIRFTPVPVAAGEPHTVSVWAYVSALSGGAFVAKVEWLDAGGSVVNYDYTVVNSIDGGFVRRTFTSIPGTGAATGRVIFALEGGGTVYLDEWQIEQAAAAGVYNEPDVDWMMRAVFTTADPADTAGAIGWYIDRQAIRPYEASFASIGFLAAARTYQVQTFADTAWAWLAWYRDHIEPDGTMYDYDVSGGTLTKLTTRDSTDSYAGLYLLVLRAAMLVDPRTLSGFATSIGKALDAIDLTLQPDGLTWASPEFHAKYLMDQVETAAGAFAAAELAATLGDSDLADRATLIGQRMVLAVEGVMWNPSTSGGAAYDWALSDVDAHTVTVWGQILDALQQAWAVIFGAPDTTRSADLMDVFLTEHPDWADQTATGRYDPLVAVALQRAGYSSEAAAGLDKVRQVSQADDRAWDWNVMKAGWLVLAEHQAADLLYDLPDPVLNPVGDVAASTSAAAAVSAGVVGATTATTTAAVVVAAQVSSPGAATQQTTVSAVVAAGVSAAVAATSVAGVSATAAVSSPAAVSAQTSATVSATAGNLGTVTHTTTAVVSAAASAAASASADTTAATSAQTSVAAQVSSPAAATASTFAAATVSGSAVTAGAVSASTAAAAAVSGQVSSPATAAGGTTAAATVSASAATPGSADTSATVTAAVEAAANTSTPATVSGTTTAGCAVAASAATSASATVSHTSSAAASVSGASASTATSSGLTVGAVTATAVMSSPATAAPTVSVAATAAASAVTAGVGQVNTSTTVAAVAAGSVSSPAAVTAATTATVSAVASSSTGADGTATHTTSSTASVAASVASPAAASSVTAAAVTAAAGVQAAASGITSAAVTATAGVPATASATVTATAAVAASIGTAATHTTSATVSAAAQVSSPAAVSASTTVASQTAARVGAAATSVSTVSATVSAQVAYPANVAATSVAAATVAATVGIGVSASTTASVSAAAAVSSPAHASHATTVTAAVAALVPASVGAQVAAMATVTAMVTLPTATVQAVSTVAALVTALRADTSAAQAVVVAAAVVTAYTGRPGTLSVSHGDRSGLHATHSEGGLAVTHSTRTGLEASHA